MTETAERHVASYDVLLDGESIPREHRDRIKEIRVLDDLRLPDVCSVVVAYPRGEGVDSQPFEIGKTLEVRLGAREEMAPQTLFRGQVVTLEPDFGAGGCSMVVRAFDRAHLLNRSRRVRTFQNQTSSDIVAKIVREAGLTARCDPSGEPHPFIAQDNETDLDFIWRLAERVGFEFIVEDTTAHFRRPSPDGAIALEWPTTLHEFSPRVTAVQQVSEVTLLAQDPATGDEIEASASRPNQIARIGLARDTVKDAFAAAQLHVATEPVKSRAEGNALAQALLDRIADGYVAADGVAPGNPKIKAGAQLEVAGVGRTFSGTYRVASSTHVLRGGGAYETHFANAPSSTVLGLLSQGRAAAPAFAAHLVIGVVTNNEDPEGLARVRVRYPALGREAESAWARLAVPSAGKERGLLMLPVVGEEVLVGFEHDDTTRPYVLGSLFNGRDTPGDDLLQGQDGSLAVRSDKKIFTECKEDHTLRSGRKLIVEVSDNVEESFQRDWTNKTSGKASLKATGAFEVEGQSVSGKAQMGLTLEANSSLTLKCGPSQIELSASGVTIRGPMINLG